MWIYNGASLHIDQPHPRQKHSEIWLVGWLVKRPQDSCCNSRLQVIIASGYKLDSYNILCQYSYAKSSYVSILSLDCISAISWGQRSAYIWLTYSTYLLLALMSSHNTFIVGSRSTLHFTVGRTVLTLVFSPGPFNRAAPYAFFTRFPLLWEWILWCGHRLRPNHAHPLCLNLLLGRTLNLKLETILPTMLIIVQDCLYIDRRLRAVYLCKQCLGCYMLWFGT